MTIEYDDEVNDILARRDELTRRAVVSLRQKRDMLIGQLAAIDLQLARLGATEKRPGPAPMAPRFIGLRTRVTHLLANSGAMTLSEAARCLGSSKRNLFPIVRTVMAEGLIGRRLTGGRGGEHEYFYTGNGESHLEGAPLAQDSHVAVNE